MMKSFKRAVIHLDVLELSGSLNVKRSSLIVSAKRRLELRLALYRIATTISIKDCAYVERWLTHWCVAEQPK